MSDFFETPTLFGSFKTSIEEPSNYWQVKQFHSDQIVELDLIKNSKEALPGDGIIWKNSQLERKDQVVVYTADCLPILIEGENGGALLHAGWRGIHQKIYLKDEIKQLKPLKVVIGPSIYVDSFEVTNEFLDYFPGSKNFVTRDEEQKLFFDLQNEVKLNLLHFFPKIDFQESFICTFENIQYNSFRRTNSTKRNYNSYQLREA